MKTRFSRWLATLCASAFIAACGGGGGDPLPPAAPAAVFDTAKAVATAVTLDGRKVKLSASSDTTLPKFEKEDLFTWAERWSKDSKVGFFTKGPVTQTGTFDGAEFMYRDYPSSASIRIRADGAVFVWWPDGTLRQHGVLADYACAVVNCADPTTAGLVTFSAEGGTSATITPNYKGSLITALGAEVDGVGKGFEIMASDVDEVCFRSNRLLNWGKRGGPGCNMRADNGDLRITRIPNNDCGRFTLWTKAGLELWLDFDHPRGWKFDGLNAKANAACGIEYGPNGFKPAKITAVREADGTASLVWDFGSDYLGGFFGKDGQPLVFAEGKVYGFLLNGNRTGKGYSSGWGLGEGRKTTSGDLIAPSVTMAWLNFADGRFTVKFTNLACTDRVNVTVHSGSGPADKVVYDPGPDGFGLAWAGLPYQANPSVWTDGDGVIFDPAKGQLEYGAPFCTVK